MTGTHPREQGTGSQTTRGQGTTGVPATLEERKRRGQSTREGGGREDRREDTQPRRRDTKHRRDGHRPTPAHLVDTGTRPRDTATPRHKTDHPRGARPARHGSAAQTRQRTTHTGSRPQASSPHTGEGGYTHTGNQREHRTTHHRTLTARRRPRPPSTAGATTQTQGHRHRRERGRGCCTKDGGQHGGRETGWEGKQQSRGDQPTLRDPADS